MRLTPRRTVGALSTLTALAAVVAAPSGHADVGPADAASRAVAPRTVAHWTDAALTHPDSIPFTELVGQIPMPKLQETEVHLSMTAWGYRFQGGMANQHLTITEVEGGLRFVDTAARTWAKLPGNCTVEQVPQAAAAVCTTPESYGDELFVEFWPRLGNDYVNARGLSSRYRLWALTDAGNDTAKGGAGRDFINTAFDRDRATGGGGEDWIRVGTGTNRVFGGEGDDRLMGGDDRDAVHGGPGDDRVGGLAGSDRLWGDDGSDIVVGGTGSDVAYVDGADRWKECESVRS